MRTRDLWVRRAPQRFKFHQLPTKAMREDLACDIWELRHLYEVTLAPVCFRAYWYQWAPHLKRTSAERRWERFKALLLAWRIPHDRLEMNTIENNAGCVRTGAIVTVNKATLDDMLVPRMALPTMRCNKLGWAAAWLKLMREES